VNKRKISKRRLTAADYAALARWRQVLRQFSAFSESAAHAEGLPSQQHQAILAIKGQADRAMTVGALAEMLLITPHAATELVDRLCAGRLVVRRKDPCDRRRLVLTLTSRAERILHTLSVIHLQEIRENTPALVSILRALVRK
jgi:DNA-binding MarR family transcriptional regulator